MPTPQDRGARPGPWIALGVIAAVCLLPRAASLVWRSIEILPERWQEAGRALAVPATQRIEDVAGIAPALVRVLRGRTPPDGDVVVFSPLPGELAEFLLRTQFERLKNLLWPHPRRFHYAKDAAAVAARATTAAQGRLVLVDYTVPQPDRPQVPGEWQRLHRGRFEQVWLLQEAPR